MTVRRSIPWTPTVIALGVLVLLAPVFAVAATAVGYAEPLEIAAERTGAVDAIETMYTGLFPEYTVPGIDSPVETLFAAAIGTAATFGVALGVGRFLER